MDAPVAADVVVSPLARLAWLEPMSGFICMDACLCSGGRDTGIEVGPVSSLSGVPNGIEWVFALVLISKACVGDVVLHTGLVCALL
jgi:hypothetical protein